MLCMDFPPDARGIGQYVYNLSKTLIKNGHEVTVITRGNWKKTKYENFENIKIFRVRFIPLFPFHLRLHGIFLNRLIKTLEEEFDIIHLHNPSIPLLNTSVPMIITVHGTVIGGIKNRKILDFFSFGLKLFSKLYENNEKNLLNNVDKITAVSKSCMDELKLYYGVNDVQVVYNGVDTDFFTPILNKNKGKYILYVGALDSLKGLIDLINSAKYITFKNLSLKFILIGKGHMKKYLKKLIRKNSLENNFSLMGYLNQKKLLGYYQNASIFVLPSYHEGLPTAVLEAMSCGIPIVATAVPGTSEIIEDGETGLLVPPKSPKKLADSIMGLLDDQELIKKFSKNGRKHVEKNFNWFKITDNFEKIYSNVINHE